MAVIGTKNRGGPIDSIGTPVVQWDSTSSDSYVFLRYETTDEAQFFLRIDKDNGKMEKTKALWTDRLTADFIPLN